MTDGIMMLCRKDFSDFVETNIVVVPLNHVICFAMYLCSTLYCFKKVQCPKVLTEEKQGVGKRKCLNQQQLQNRKIDSIVSR